VLSAPLHADVHIGIDVVAEQVAYTFIYGQGRREIFRDRSHSGCDELIKPRLAFFVTKANIRINAHPIR